MATNMPTGLDTFTDPASTDTMDGNGGTKPAVEHDVQHTNINDAVTAIEKVLVGPNVFNVVGYGATGNGSTDDSGAIQAAINACPAGGIVYFPPPTSTYAITSTLVIPGQITLQGPNGRTNAGGSSGQIITMKAGANLDAVIAETNWYNNVAGTISDSIQIRDLTINANESNQTGGLGHGIAGKYWRSQIAYCGINNARNNGIELSLTTRNGSTVDSTNHCIENHFTDNLILGSQVAAIHTQGANVTDNFIVNNVLIGTITSSTHTGVLLDGNGGAGSRIVGNHTYRSANGIIISGSVSYTTIEGNYIEASNAPASYGATYCIEVSINGDEVVIANNKVGFPASVLSGNTYFGIWTQSAALGGWAIVGNHVGSVGSGFGTGIYVNTHSFVTSNVTVSGNSVDTTNIATPYNLTNSPADAGAAFGLGIPTTSTVGFDRLPSCAGAPTGVPHDLTQGVPMMYDTTNHKIWIYDGAWKGVVVT